MGCFRLAGTILVCSLAGAAAPDGGSVYRQRCAACHDRGIDRAPNREALAGRIPEDVLRTMTTGSMKQQASGLSSDEMRAVSTFVTGKDFGTVKETAGIHACSGTAPGIDLGRPSWTGWGNGLENRRYQEKPGITAAGVPRLKLKWAFGYPDRIAFGQPTLAGGRLFVSTSTGKVYSLDPKTGCVYWSIDTEAGVRSAIQVGPMPKGSAARYAAYFGDEKARVYAVDAATGQPIWSVKVDDHPVARITGSPLLYRNRLYVPVSSIEEAMATNPKYECCKFQGAVAALDAYTGKLIWKTRTLSAPPAPLERNSAGTQMYGPAGAAVWSAPTLDLKRRVIYVGTGNSYTDVETSTANAILALDMETGSLKWSQQVTVGDNFIVGCITPGRGNCPKKPGPDVDFGSPPILHTGAGGRQVILAGQKSGVMYAMDPDNRGKVLWAAQVGAGGALGGIEWGSAVDRENVYVAVSDVIVTKKGTAKPGLTAIRIATGERVWQFPAPAAECSWGKFRCLPAQSAAVTAIPGVVFSGSMDGRLRAHSTATGALIWEFDTGKPFETVNGIKAAGGAIDATGPAIAGGMLFLNSGYGRLIGQPGNVLLAFAEE